MIIFSSRFENYQFSQDIVDIGQHYIRILYINKSNSLKKELDAFAKSLDQCQSGQYTQADLVQNCLSLLNLLHINSSPHTIPTFNDPEKENIVGKGENDFPAMFSTLPN